MQAEHHDITLPANLKLDDKDKEINEEETSEFVPNPPELNIIFKENNDCQTSTDHLHQDNSPIIEVFAEDTKTSKKSSVTLYILIWLPRYNKGQFGHASLARQDPEFYISWWPGNLLNKLIKKPPGTKKSLGEDVTDEGREPDHVFCLETDKMEAVEEFWRKNQNDTYHILRNNCIKKVYEALREAGAPEFIPDRKIISLFLYYLKIESPEDFHVYCQKNFEPVKYDEIFKHTKPMHKDMTLAEPINDDHEVPQQASNTCSQLLACRVFSLFGHMKDLSEFVFSFPHLTLALLIDIENWH